MNILHVLSQFEVTGAETFAATLADEQIRNGHTVFIVSDTFHTPAKAEIIFHPIGKRSLAQRWENINFLRNFIREKNIHVVNAHSRAASWVSYFATRRGETPLVSHIHGRVHVHFSSKNFPIYGEKLIAVSKAIHHHLNTDLKYSLEKLALVKNGINLHDWKFFASRKKSSAKKTVAYVGRLSGMKGDMLLVLIQKVFPKVMEQFPGIEFQIIGGMNERSKILPTIEAANRQIGKDFIIAKGFTNNIQEIYSSADVIIGSGRVVIEALAVGAPVISIGESSYEGIISEATKEYAQATNFGDHDKNQPLDPDKIASDIVTVLTTSNATTAEWGRNFVSAEHNITKVAKELDFVYAEARAEKKGIHEIPVLMYHRVTEKPPENSIFNVYVTTQEFEEQLKFFKEKGFTTLTFYDIQNIIEGKGEIPSKPLMVTFDDGYEDNYLCAFPLLKKYGMMAVIFLIGDPAIRSNVWDVPKGEPEASLMSDAQIREMADAGIEFGSHTMTHKKLTLCLPDVYRNEITESKVVLEKRVGKEIISFAYPYGALSEEIKHAVEQAGYKFGIATDTGRRNFWADVFKIRRIQIFSHTPKSQLWKKTSGKYHWYKNVY